MFDTFMGVAPRSAGWANKDPADDYWYGPRGLPTVSGEKVSEETALAITTLFACVNKIAKTLATLPAQVYEQMGPRERRPVDHWLNEIYTRQANPDATALTVRESMKMNLLVWGGSYTEVVPTVGGGDVAAWYPLESRLVTVKRDRRTGRLYYEYRGGGSVPDQIPAERILHIPGLSLNGVTGLSVVGFNRESLGLGVAVAKFGAAFFGNQAVVGGFVKRPKGAPKWSKEKGQAFIDSVNEKFRGAKNAWGWALLRDDMDITQLQMPLEDAMFLGTRETSAVEICGMFDTPPWKIHLKTEMKFRNAEQANLEWVTDTILPLAIRHEVAMNARFLAGTRLHIRHNIAGLLRGDFKAQQEGFAWGRQWGWWSVNDIREMLGQNPIEGGDEYLVPLNMSGAGDPRPQTTGGSEGSLIADVSGVQYAVAGPTATPSRPSAITTIDVPSRPVVNPDAFRPAAEAAARLVIAKETKAVANSFQRRAALKSTEAFAAWLDKFYGELAGYATECLGPIIQSFEGAAGATVGPTAAEIAEQHATSHHDVLLSLLDDPGGVPDLLAQWKETQPQAMADGLLNAFREAIEGDPDE
ncbi:MAG: phage portal protein [Planctomycetota bacterium]|jgi:HK97 family phage portal protein